MFSYQFFGGVNKQTKPRFTKTDNWFDYKWDDSFYLTLTKIKHYIKTEDKTTESFKIQNMGDTN